MKPQPPLQFRGRTYTVTQTVNGCTSLAGSGIAAPKTTPVAPAVTVVDNCNGTSTLTASAYTGTLLWSTNETTASITVSVAGTYSVTQTVNGCTSLAGSGIAAPKTTPVAPAVTVVDNCMDFHTHSFGLIPGHIVEVPMKPQLPLLYLWQDPILLLKR